MNQLIARAENAAWDPVRDIDWSGGPARPRFMPLGLYRALVSQLYHGERATLAMCNRLEDEIPDRSARRFLAAQAADEARHAEAYARYLDRLGGIARLDPAMQRTFDAALDWDGPWQGLVVASHVLLESEAVRLLQRSPYMFSCPLLRRINRRVVRDEARHLAFGQHTLRRRLNELSPAERQRIYRWVGDLWHQAVHGRRGVLSLLGCVNRGALRRVWLDHEAELRGIGLVGSA